MLSSCGYDRGEGCDGSVIADLIRNPEGWQDRMPVILALRQYPQGGRELTLIGMERQCRVSWGFKMDRHVKVCLGWGLGMGGWTAWCGYSQSHGRVC